MGYSFTVSKYYRVKKAGKFPWPCGSEPDRTISLFLSDVLTSDGGGKYTKQTGFGCFGIELKDDEVELVTDPITLTML